MILVARPEPTVAAAFADSEAEAFLHSYGVNEISRDGYVVARHNHFGAFGEMCNTGDVGGAEV